MDNELRELIIDLHNYVDPKHFIERSTLFTPTGPIAFGLRPHQLDWVEQLKRGNKVVVVGEERQTGRTSFMAACSLHRAMFNPHIAVAYISFNWRLIEYARHLVLKMYDTTPDHIRSKVIRANKQSIEFENGSQIYFTAVPSHRSLRGRTLDLISVDGGEYLSELENLELISNIAPVLMSPPRGQLITTSGYGWNI